MCAYEGGCVGAGAGFHRASDKADELAGGQRGGTAERRYKYDDGQMAAIYKKIETGTSVSHRATSRHFAHPSYAARKRAVAYPGGAARAGRAREDFPRRSRRCAAWQWQGGGGRAAAAAGQRRRCGAQAVSRARARSGARRHVGRPFTTCRATRAGARQGGYGGCVDFQV